MIVVCGEKRIEKNHFIIFKQYNFLRLFGDEYQYYHLKSEVV